MKKYNNILIVRTDRVGDVVLTTPAIKALKKNFPQAKISILVQPITRELVDGNPDLDEVIIDDREQQHKGLNGFLKLVGMLRSKKYDLAIVYHTKKRTNLTCFCAGIPQRIGYKNNKFGFLLTHPIEDQRHHGEKHEAQYCLDVLSELGIKENSLELFIPEQEYADDWADQFLRQNNIKEKDQVIVIHAGASDPSKQWPQERFVELIQMLLKKFHCKIILIGASNVRSIHRNIVLALDDQIYDLTGLTTIAQLVSILKKSNLLISNDSGPVHVAAGVGAPVVSIFTRNQPGINPKRWCPLGLNSAVVSVPFDEEPDFQKAGSATEEYLTKIPTQEVFEVALKFLKK